jgi:hypothetical protein
MVFKMDLEWGTIVIPATQEAEAGGLQVQGVPGQLRETLSQKFFFFAVLGL